MIQGPSMDIIGPTVHTSKAFGNSWTLDRSCRHDRAEHRIDLAARPADTVDSGGHWFPGYLGDRRSRTRRTMQRTVFNCRLSCDKRVQSAI